VQEVQQFHLCAGGSNSSSALSSLQHNRGRRSTSSSSSIWRRDDDDQEATSFVCAALVAHLITFAVHWSSSKSVTVRHKEGAQRSGPL
jgi:hypothetical protein